ncbi:hypothetical protein KIW84_023708 [Lathyrus oleraceus]|uniref:DUF7745 domain-containing protein n=1 Tax=Pisum sativum TaxID=3888 RepID=A0A9D5BC40_PEA|nr:hypothetical protein KIW84_023708 [Pisum sativum]
MKMDKRTYTLGHSLCKNGVKEQLGLMPLECYKSQRATRPHAFRMLNLEDELERIIISKLPLVHFFVCIIEVFDVCSCARDSNLSLIEEPLSWASKDGSYLDHQYDLKKGTPFVVLFLLLYPLSLGFQGSSWEASIYSGYSGGRSFCQLLPILDQLPFRGLERVPTSQEITDMLHIDESLVGAHMTTKGGIQGLPSEFLIAQATLYGKAMSEDAFEAIFVLLIYGLVLFPNIDKFVDVTLLGFSLLLIPFRLCWTVSFKENKGCLRWSTRLMSLTNDDIFWYNRVYDGVQIIDSCGEFSNVPLLGTYGGINYNPILARRQLGFPLMDKTNNILLEGVFFQKGKDPQGLKGRMVCAWRKIHRKGRKELGPKNCIALEPYTSWVRRRASEYLMPYEYLRPTPLVVAGPSTLPNQGVIDEPDDVVTSLLPQSSRFWKRKYDRLAKEKANMEAAYEREVKRRRASYLPQENRELKEEVARLTALMESFMAAQSQSTPTPSTPPQRTVISEIASSTVPAASAHFGPTTMPAGFPWGMPANFVPEGLAPTFASLSASSPVLAIPPPIVHTMSRVDDTIYHSEPSEGPNVYENMDSMNDQFLELRKELKTLRGKNLFGKSAAELCLVRNVKIPIKFKVPDFEKYKGNTCPLSHLVMYARKMSTQTDND